MNKPYIHILLLIFICSTYSISIICSQSGEEYTVLTEEKLFVCNIFVIDKEMWNCTQARTFARGSFSDAATIPNSEKGRAIAAELTIQQDRPYLKCSAKKALIPIEENKTVLSALRSLMKKDPLARVMATTQVGVLTDTNVYNVNIPLCIFPLRPTKTLEVCKKIEDREKTYKAQLHIHTDGHYKITYDVPATKQSSVDRCGELKSSTLSRPFTSEQIRALFDWKNSNDKTDLFLVTQKKNERKVFCITHIEGNPNDLSNTPVIDVHVTFEQTLDKFPNFTCYQRVELAQEGLQKYLVYEIDGQKRKDKICCHSELDTNYIRGAIGHFSCYLVDETKKKAWNVTKISYIDLPSATNPKSPSFIAQHPIITSIMGMAGIAGVIAIYYYSESCKQFFEDLIQRIMKK